MADRPFIHPYIPNAVPATKEAMLRELGLDSVEEIYAEIPDRLRFKGRLDIPEPILAERDLRRHVKGLLDRNTSCEENLNFCGAGCWQHYVPAVVDEVINRAEFLSAYCGGSYSDLGKYQARFEFNSQLGELLDLDGVANPIYDWGDVAGRSFRMAKRITGRARVLVPAHDEPHATGRGAHALPARRHALARGDRPGGLRSGYRRPRPRRPARQARRRRGRRVLGEPRLPRQRSRRSGAEIVRLAHEHGALAIAGVDPITLGVLTPPGTLGADIACGDIQCLGMHMHAGAGCSGFIAFRDDDPVFAQECPLELYTLLRTETPGEWQVAEALPERTSLRRPRPGQGLGRHGVRPVDHRGGRLHDGHGPPGLQGARRDLHRRARTTRPGGWPSCPASRSSSRRPSSRSSW